MAPTRPKTKKGKKKPPPPSILLYDAASKLEAGQPLQAAAVAKRALEFTGEGGDFALAALNLLGQIHVELGELDDARDYFSRAVALDADGTVDERVGGGEEKFLWLAQLSDEGGRDSVAWFERGSAALRRQIQALAALDRSTGEQAEALAEKRRKLAGTLCAVAEVYMTDLSWEADAEQRCEALITEATLVAPELAETWQTVANVRISQQRVDEAREALRRSLDLWRELPPDDPAVPDFPTRVALSRLLLEVAMEQDALEVLERLGGEDDESVEVQYLGGWGSYIVGEKEKAAGKPDDEGWRATWKSARRWLTRCLLLYEGQEYEDEKLKEHAGELLSAINKEIGEPTDEDEDEDAWEDDEEDSEEGDDDMAE